MKRKKPVIFVGIIVMLVGIGIILYPIINQMYSSYKQEQFMKEVKGEILKNLNDLSDDGKDNAAVNDNDVPDSTNLNDNSNENTESNDDLQGNEISPDNAGSANEGAGNDDGSGEAADVVTAPGIDDTPSLNEIEEQETVEEASIYDNKRLRGQKCIGIIEIPAIDLIYVIVEGTDTDNIGVAIGHFSNSVAIGEDGNCALAGHNGGTYGRYFGDIDELEIGDEVKMINLLGEEYTYEVYDSFIVEPHETYVVKELDEPGKILTMVTCTNHGTQRLIVRARCTKEPEIIENADEL